MRRETLKKLNLLKPKADKKCYHIKYFKNVFRKINAQSVIEYSFLIVCIIVALVAMQSYIKRGIQGKLRQSADQIGTQYEPGQTSSDFTITSRSNITSVSILEKIDEDTINTTTVVTTNYDTQERTGTETVGAF